MNIQQEILHILDEAMGLKGRAMRFTRETVLLGALPELDSMAVLAVISGFEDRFGFVVEDDDLDGAIFASVGTLADYVSNKLEG